jgi:hypothetical protein
MPAHCGTGSMTTSTTVAELMRLYRMLYRQDKEEEAARVARQVEALNPVVGRAALELVHHRDTFGAGCCASSHCGSCAECGACSGCCASCCTSPARTAAKDCACGDGCKCCKGDRSDCACGQGCKCKPAKPVAGSGCHGTLVFGIGACLPGMPCPVPMMMPPCPPAPPAASMTVGGPSPLPMPCPMSACPMMSFVGPVPVPLPPPCCCPAACGRHKGPAETGTMREDRSGDCAPVCITANGSRVHISTPAVEVECDRLLSMSRGDRVQLEGNVSVEFRSGDRPATISADQMSVGLRDGSYTIGCPAGGDRVKKHRADTCDGAEATKPDAGEDCPGAAPPRP